MILTGKKKFKLRCCRCGLIRIVAVFDPEAKREMEAHAKAGTYVCSDHDEEGPDQPAALRLSHGESRTDFAVRIYDTAEPPVTYYRAAKLAGINPVTLYQRLRRREQREATRCPHCHQAPGERPRPGAGRSGKTRPPSP